MFIEPPAQPGTSGTVEAVKGEGAKRGHYKRGPAKKRRYIITKNPSGLSLIVELLVGKTYVEAGRLKVECHSEKWHGHIRRVMNLVKNEKLTFGEGEKYLKRCYGEHQVKVS